MHFIGTLIIVSYFSKMLKLYSYTPKNMVISCFTNRPLCTFLTSSSKSKSYCTSSTRDYMNKVASRILGSETPGLALSYFDKVKDQIDVTKNRHAHSAVVHVLSKAKWYLRARGLLKCLIEDLLKSCTSRRVCAILYKDLNRVGGGEMGGDVVGVLMISLCEMGFVDEAVWVYRKGGELPVKQACNAVLNGLVKKGRYSFVWEMYGEMVARGLSPCVVTYGTLIDACCGEGDVVKARMLYDEMVGKEMKPTVVIFTTLIRGLCKESRMSEAEDLFRAMKQLGVAPNLYTYNVFMDGYGKMGNLRCALGFYSDMLSCNIESNVVTFGILIDAFCRNGEMDAARTFFPCMMKAGILPNVFVYNSLIDGFSKARNISEALALYEEMVKFCILPDVYSYSILIKGLSEVGRVKEASELLLRMKNDGILTNTVTYNSLVYGHCKQGDMESALKLCSQMMEEGIELNAVTFSTLIHGYCKEGNMEAASGIYLEMVIKGITPDVVIYTNLIHGHFKNGDTKAALGMYKEMQEVGLIPSAFTVSCLIDGLCKNGRVNDAFKLFLEFTNSVHFEGTQNQFDADTFPVNHVAYTALIQGLCKEGRIFKASKFFSDMRARGLRADQATYIIILLGHFRAKHVHNLLMLQADMMKLGLLPDTVICPLLHKAYQNCGDFKSAVRCFEDLLRLGLVWSGRSLPVKRPLIVCGNQQVFCE